MQAFGMRYRSSALAQEKTGEFWVDARMFGGYVRADVENAEVVVFIGNPYQSHGFPRARSVLKEIAKDPTRTMIVIDPVRTETAVLADVHFAVRPGTVSYLLAALAAILFRDPSWRRRGPDGALRISPVDAEHLGLTPGARARLTTSKGSLEGTVEPTDRMQPWHVSLPNGFGLGEYSMEVAGVDPTNSPRPSTATPGSARRSTSTFRRGSKRSPRLRPAWDEGTPPTSRARTARPTGASSSPWS
ncbi:molybdopterin dinucleotide binding domain-containing protein [Streptomyces chartreusis]|uniref:molybdopterin dinucleotide binding domain-containing protein n=1 Tax=Streptomyces chartreusis TaxID=1969 RepID=UPI0036BDCC4F